MAVILTEGFETQSTNKWTGSPSWEVYTAANARTGDYATRSLSATKTVAPAEESATFIGGFAHKNGYNVNASLLSFRGDAGATTHVSLYRLVGNYLAIYIGGTQVASTSPVPYLSSSYNYLEMKATLADVGGQVDVWYNGGSAPILSYTGDTKNGGTDTVFDTFVITGPSFQFIDDIYLSNGEGPAPFNDRLGDIRCWPLRPNGNGAASQLVGSDGNSTDNYLLVDEASATFADYVGHNTVSNKDTYTYGNLTPTTGTVVDLQVGSVMRKNDAGGRSMRALTRVGGVDYPGSDVTLGLTATYYSQRYGVNPATGLAWTIAEVNAAEFGAEVRP